MTKAQTNSSVDLGSLSSNASPIVGDVIQDTIAEIVGGNLESAGLILDESLLPLVKAGVQAAAAGDVEFADGSDSSTFSDDDFPDQIVDVQRVPTGDIAAIIALLRDLPAGGVPGQWVDLPLQ
jgi:hypothetical protein